MAAETQFTANTGMVSISTANPNLDGSGTLGIVLTAGLNGTIVKRIIVKSTDDTSQGMIRLFIDDGTSSKLLREIKVPAVTKGSNFCSFYYALDTRIRLENGFKIKASTEVGEPFNVIAEGLDWEYFPSAVRPESTNFTAKTGTVVINTANPNLDGTGTLGTVITANSGSGWRGLKINTITIKALQNTSRGMVRLFLNDGTNTLLLNEIRVPAVAQAGTVPSFMRTFFLKNFVLQAGWSILASTEIAEDFAITAIGNDWTYP